MQEDLGDRVMQCDLLALNVMFEAARPGEAGKWFAQQAFTLRSPSWPLERDNALTCAPAEAGARLQAIESRIDILARERDNISALATEIDANSSRAIHALQFEDVESLVVVYSKDLANNPRALVTEIEARHSALKAGIAANQEDLSSITDSLRQRLEALPDDSRQNPVYPASQNSLDRNIGEMF